MKKVLIALLLVAMVISPGIVSAYSNYEGEIQKPYATVKDYEEPNTFEKQFLEPIKRVINVFTEKVEPIVQEDKTSIIFDMGPNSIDRSRDVAMPWEGKVPEDWEEWRIKKLPRMEEPIPGPIPNQENPQEVKFRDIEVNIDVDIVDGGINLFHEAHNRGNIEMTFTTLTEIQKYNENTREWETVGSNTEMNNLPSGMGMAGVTFFELKPGYYMVAYIADLSDEIYINNFDHEVFTIHGNN